MKMPPEGESQIAYDSRSFQRKFNIGNTKMHAEIGAGRLKARYMGRKLIITHEDGVAWLNGLPERPPSHERAA